MKLMIALAAVFAGLTSFGELSWAMVNTEKYASDESPSAATEGYTAYLCLASTAQTLFSAKDVAGVTEYFVNNFADGKSTLAQEGNASALDAIDWGLGQYSFSTYFPPTGAGSLGTEEYLGIVLYSSDEEDAVRVFSATSDGRRWIADDSAARPAGTAGAWTQAVPEPTSGLLVLLGFASLALRRKQQKG